jgi:hypothetical protein
MSYCLLTFSSANPNHCAVFQIILKVSLFIVSMILWRHLDGAVSNHLNGVALLCCIDDGCNIVVCYRLFWRPLSIYSW